MKWLSDTTGKTYRLLSDAEAEYVAGDRIEPRQDQPRYFFGNEEEHYLCAYANGADETAKTIFPNWPAAPCKDGHVFTAPVAHLKTNVFGLCDVHGNAWSWTEDCR